VVQLGVSAVAAWLAAGPLAGGITAAAGAAALWWCTTRSGDRPAGPRQNRPAGPRQKRPAQRDGAEQLAA
jgi:hypothetical protein